MYFHDLDNLVNMDGHGAFVWAAYAISLATILLMLLAPLRRRRRLLREIDGELRRSRGAESAGGDR